MMDATCYEAAEFTQQKWNGLLLNVVAAGIKHKIDAGIPLTAAQQEVLAAAFYLKPKFYGGDKVGDMAEFGMSEGG